MIMDAVKFNEFLHSRNACSDAIAWARGKSFEQCYNECTRADWMIWIFTIINPEHYQLRVLAVAKCVNMASYLLTNNASKNALKIALDYGNGKQEHEWLIEARKHENMRMNYLCDPGDGIGNLAAYSVFEATYGGYSAILFAQRALLLSNNIAETSSNAAVNRAEMAGIIREVLPIEIWNI